MQNKTIGKTFSGVLNSDNFTNITNRTSNDRLNGQMVDHIQMVEWLNGREHVMTYHLFHSGKVLTP